MRRRLTALLGGAMLVLAASLLTACSPGAGGADGSADAPADSGIVLENGWAKAGEQGGMTGVFGTLVNAGADDAVITRVESDAAEMIELHEVDASGTMREIEGDVIIPAEGSYELAPGADHIMLMGLTRELLAGDEVVFTVHFRSGDVEFSEEFAVPVKDYAGANESYDDLGHGDDGHGAHGGAHGDDAHGDGSHGEEDAH